MANPDKSLKGSVPNFLDTVRKKTGGELIHGPVVYETFAAYAVPGTAGIGTITFFCVGFLFAFHG